MVMDKAKKTVSLPSKEFYWKDGYDDLLTYYLCKAEDGLPVVRINYSGRLLRGRSGEFESQESLVDFLNGNRAVPPPPCCA